MLSGQERFASRLKKTLQHEGVMLRQADNFEDTTRIQATIDSLQRTQAFMEPLPDVRGVSSTGQSTRRSSRSPSRFSH